MPEIENLVIFLFGASMIVVMVTMRVESYIKTLAFQGLLLFLLVLARMERLEGSGFFLLSAQTLGLKAIGVPSVLTAVIRRHGPKREVETVIPNRYAVLLATLSLVAGLYIAHRVGPLMSGARPLLVGVGFSVMMNGLIIIVTRKKIITQVMGYLLLENGVFLLSLSVAAEMPLVVNMGLLLDVFVGVFLVGLFFNRVGTAFDGTDGEALRG